MLVVGKPTTYRNNTTTNTQHQMKETIVSPVVPIRYPFLQKPDTKFKPEGEYKVDLILDPQQEDQKKFLRKLENLRKKAIEEIVKERGGKKKIREANSLIKKDEDLETGAETGLYKVTAKLQAHVNPKSGKPFEQSPVLFAKNGTLFASEALIGNGTKAQVSMEGYPYYNPSAGAGLTLRLKAVLIVDLVEYTGGGGTTAASFGFTTDDEVTTSEEDDAPEYESVDLEPDGETQDGDCPF